MPTPSISPASNATLYDGRSARPWRVHATVHDGALRLEGEAVAQRVPLAALASERDRTAGCVVLTRSDQPDWRLRLDPGVASPPLVRTGGRARREVRLVAALTAAVAGTAVLAWAVGAPLLEAAARLVPRRVTEAVGDDVVAQLAPDGGCDAAPGAAALGALAARVGARDVVVIESAQANALAAPGGRIVLFSGLIAKAASPDEVAGVLAHEATHVALHHPEGAMVRYFGVSLAAAAIGGDMGGVADLATLLASTRAKEADADAGAARAMARADLPPAALATMLERLGDARARSRGTALDRLGSYASTHPGGADRAARLRAAPTPAHPRPALDPAQWAALRRICTA